MAEYGHKYDEVYHYLKSMILDGSLGYMQRIPPENALAAQFSLSRFTVRRAIELLVEEGFLETRHGSGTYVKATSPAQNRSGVVGVVTTYLDDYIFPSIVRGIENVLTQSRFSISLGLTGNQTEKEKGCLRSMLSQKVDGLILEGTKSALISPNVPFLEKLRERGVPVVYINGGYADFDASSVLMDDEGNAGRLTEYLLARGHRQFAAIFKSDDIQGHRRCRGMLRTLREHGITLPEKRLLWYTTEEMHRLLSPEYAQLLQRRVAGCTALVCYNDQVAMGAAQALLHCGVRVPDDVSVAGFDNSELCEISPVRLTSVSHARGVMGEAAANLLLSLLGGGPAQQICLPSEIVERDSVKTVRTAP